MFKTRVFRTSNHENSTQIDKPSTSKGKNFNKSRGKNNNATIKNRDSTLVQGNKNSNPKNLKNAKCVQVIPIIETRAMKAKKALVLQGNLKKTTTYKL